MKIRKATKKDFKRIAELMKKEYVKKPYKEKWTISNGLKTLNYYKKIANIYVGIIEKKIVGFVIFRYEYYNTGFSTMVKEIVVDSKIQGKGVGKVLMNKVEADSKKKKCNIVWLITGKKAPAFKFYKKMKYKPSQNTVVLEKMLK